MALSPLRSKNMSPLLSVSLSSVPFFPIGQAVLALRDCRETVLQRHRMSRAVGKREDHVERCRIHYAGFRCVAGVFLRGRAMGSSVSVPTAPGVDRFLINFLALLSMGEAVMESPTAVVT